MEEIQTHQNDMEKQDIYLFIDRKPVKIYLCEQVQQ